MEKTKEFLKEAGLGEMPLIFAVDDFQERFIGYIIYHQYDESSYEIGWVLHKSEWHKGYAQELTEALIRDAKKNKKILIIECVPKRKITREIALRNNFRFVNRIGNCDVYKLNLF